MKRQKCRKWLLMSIGMMAAWTAAPSMAQISSPQAGDQPVINPGKAGPPGSEGPKPGPPSSAASVTIAQIMSAPTRFAGKNVTVTSTVEETFTSWSFKLDEKQPMAGGTDSDMLVVSKEPLVTMGFEPSWLHKKVRVTGTVRILQAADFRREYGRGVDDKLFRRYENTPALIATSMKRVN